MSKVTGRPALGGVRILAETHSPALVNRLGALVAEKVISSEDVQVILMEQESSSQPSTVRHATFDEEGILRNWPIGFFEPSTVN
jgi:predicted ATPase